MDPSEWPTRSTLTFEDAGGLWGGERKSPNGVEAHPQARRARNYCVCFGCARADALAPGLQQVGKRGENQSYEANTANKSENELHVHGILSIIFQE